MVWNFQKIEYFLRMTEEKNLSEAARKMFFTPQALNKNLQQLETDLGVKLINRERGSMSNGESMRLTQEGKKLKECFMPSYMEYQAAISKMEDYLYDRRKRLRIAYFRGIIKDEFLMPLFMYLSETGEFESIELRSGELGDILQWVSNESCDIGITNIYDSERKWSGLSYLPIKKIPGRILISENHPWSKKEHITAEDMAEETMLVFEWKEELEKDNFWRNVVVKKRKAVHDMDTMFAEVKMGRGFCVIISAFEGGYDKHLVQKELPREYAFDFECCIVYRSGSSFQSIMDRVTTDRKKIWGGGFSEKEA